MRRPKKVLNYIVLPLFFHFVCLSNSILYAASIEDKKWSFEVKDYSLSEALKQISKVTGIEIVIKGDTGDILLSKSYKDYTIDRTLKDIFDSENCVMAWNYSNKGLASINIWLLGDVRSTGGSKGYSKLTKSRSAQREQKAPHGWEKIILKTQASTVPPPPRPKKVRGIEPPPMPPGLPSMKP